MRMVSGVGNLSAIITYANDHPSRGILLRNRSASDVFVTRPVVAEKGDEHQECLAPLGIGDKRREQSVLQQVLAVFIAAEPPGSGEALERGDGNW